MANEQKNNRQLIIILAAIVVVIIILGVVWWFFFRSQPETLEITPVNTDVNVTTVNASVNTAPELKPTVTTEVSEELELSRLANFFTERYGSYSSDANYQNIIDLKPYMTKKMQVTADDFIKIQKAKGEGSGFSSVVSKALSTSITSLEPVNASVRISTQRIESGDNFDANDIYYQDVILSFVKEGDVWLVDAATWQAKGITTQKTPDATDVSNTNGASDIFEQFQNQGQ